MKAVPLNDDFEEMITFAGRYAIGRGSYAPPDVVNYIRWLVPYLTHNTLVVIFNDIDSKIHEYSRRGLNLEYRAEWTELLEVIRREIIARGGRTK